jgi:hypothetical protein
MNPGNRVKTEPPTEAAWTNALVHDGASVVVKEKFTLPSIGSGLARRVLAGAT